MRIVRFWLPVILWVILIFVLSSHERAEVSEKFFINFAFFKSLHILEYFALEVLSYRALSNTTICWKRDVVIFSAIMSIFYAASDELHQQFIPTRQGRIRDVVIDATGIILATQFIWRWLPNLPQRLRRLANDWQLH